MISHFSSITLADVFRVNYLGVRKVEALAIIQARGNGSLDQSSNRENGEAWWCIFNVEPTEFAVTQKMIPMILFEATEKMDLALELEQSNFRGKIRVWKMYSLVCLLDT